MVHMKHQSKATCLNCHLGSQMTLQLFGITHPSIGGFVLAPYDRTAQHTHVHAQTYISQRIKNLTVMFFTDFLAFDVLEKTNEIFIHKVSAQV